jgi:hypothetical protein
MLDKLLAVVMVEIESDFIEVIKNWNKLWN